MPISFERQTEVSIDGTPFYQSDNLIEGDLELLAEMLEEDDGISDYVIEDTSVPGPATGGHTFWPEQRRQGPRSPHAIQALSLTSRQFELLGYPGVVSIRTIRAFGDLGIFTWADVLTMGSNYLYDAPLTPTGKRAFGHKKIALLNKVAEQCTGYNLPKHRASLTEQRNYFNDIRLATPALALPTGCFSTYADFGFKEGHQRQNIGTLMRASLSDLREWSNCSNEGKLASFIVNRLVDNIVRPFNRISK